MPRGDRILYWAPLREHPRHLGGFVSSSFPLKKKKKKKKKERKKKTAVVESHQRPSWKSTLIAQRLIGLLMLAFLHEL